MLDTITQLTQHGIRNVERVLGHEINTHTLGADQAYHLLDLVDQRIRRIVKQQVRLVKEEHQARLFRVANFRQFLEQFR